MPALLIRSFLCGWLLFCLAVLPAQDQASASFRHLGKRDGLAQSSVFAVAQDSTGFLWFATRDGLSRYDGYRFITHRPDTVAGPAGNDVRSLYVDPVTHDLWAGTLAGLSHYDATTNTFKSYHNDADDPHSLTAATVRTMLRDSHGNFWVGSSRGLNRYRPQTDDFERFYPGAPEVDLPANNISFLIEDEDGSLLVGTRAGLYRLGAAAGAGLSRVDAIGQRRLTSIARGDAGKFWIGTYEDGLLEWDARTGTVTTLAHDENDPNSLSHNNVRTLVRAPNGELWVGTFAGLNRLRAAEGAFVRYLSVSGQPGSLRDNSIRSLLVSRAGSLWVGTYYAGVHQLNERYNYFTNYRHDAYRNSLSGKVVSSFAATPEGNLWIGTEGGGLNYLDRSTGAFRHYQEAAAGENGLSGNNVKQLLLDGEDLWIGTYRRGLNRLNVKTGKFTHFRHRPEDANSLASDNVYGIHREGDLLWVLTFGGGLDILNLRDGTITHHRAGNRRGRLCSDLTRAILPSGDGGMWIGTEEGLSFAETGPDGYPINFRTELRDEKIYALHGAANGDFWVGTFSNGLYRRAPGTNDFQHYDESDGLAGNTVFGILEAEGGILWVSTDNGLSRFDPARGNFTNFDASHGLANLEYNFNAAFRMADGEMLFGGLNGFTRFSPEGLTPNNYIPPVVITRLLRNNDEEVVDPEGILPQSIDRTTSITFPYDDAAFVLEFAALDYFSPENNRYAYRMEGLDRGWNYATGAGRASYTIQREGDYTFQLRGANSDGVWNDEVRELKITVLPPAWRTWWAYLSYLLLAGALLFALINFLRMRHKIQLQQIAEQQQQELVETKLRFFTNITHEFRTPLTLILAPLKQLVQDGSHSPDVSRQLSLINRNAQRLLDLVNQVLTFRKLVTDHEPVTVTENDAATFLEDVYDSFRETARLRNIEYRLENRAGETTVWLDRDKMDKVLFNLISNAFKFTPDGGKILVLLEETDDRITVRVRDSGPGVAADIREDIFKRFYEKSAGQFSTIKSSGIGLAISRQMVGLHHGKIYVAEPTEQGGAEFVVELRRGHQHFTADEKEARKQILEGLSQLDRRDADVKVPLATEPVVNTQDLPEADPVTLLVVEDNPEIREYVTSIFSSRYRVLTAENGRTGLAAAKSFAPDIILSDVMMPEMDGLEFCHAVKTDLSISHIPVVLLTARTAEPFRIEGLRTGADDYITKPFHPEELQLRLQNIVRSRRQARDKFARVLSLDPKAVTITNLDEDFLQQAMEVVEAEMENPNFKVDDFAGKLAVSRSLLFTKIKALTGQTPNNFVKTVRLKRAAQLLTDGQLNVSQAAYAVGFKDPKYFRRCFKAQFNELPSTYGKAEKT
ncbi:hypothetical protein A3850_000875 [Lewinella sp. 4G2]|nr:hypothetical protein A3850_000875 [Lewinella sp. 4G2]